MIDKNSPIPIYYQLEEYIKHQIDKQKWLPGELLPSEREFAEQYHISRMTVRQAINNLASAGLLYRVKGKGTFIAQPKFEHHLSGLTSFTEDMKQRGLSPTNQLLNIQLHNQPSQIAHKLQLQPEESYYEIKRIRFADKDPLAFEIIYTPKRLVGELEEIHLQGSFYQYVEQKIGKHIIVGNQTIEGALATKEQANYLNIKVGDPVLIMERVSYLDHPTEIPIEFTQTIYRADKYKFHLTLHRDEKTKG